MTNFSHVDGFENSQFWHSSLDRQLHFSITLHREIFTLKIIRVKKILWYTFVVCSVRKIFLTVDGYNMNKNVGCNAVAVSCRRRSGIFLGKCGRARGSLFVDHRHVNVFIRVLNFHGWS